MLLRQILQSALVDAPGDSELRYSIPDMAPHQESEYLKQILQGYLRGDITDHGNLDGQQLCLRILDELGQQARGYLPSGWNLESTSGSDGAAMLVVHLNRGGHGAALAAAHILYRVLSVQSRGAVEEEDINAIAYWCAGLNEDERAAGANRDANLAKGRPKGAEKNHELAEDRKERLKNFVLEYWRQYPGASWKHTFRAAQQSNAPHVREAIAHYKNAETLRKTLKLKKESPPSE